MKKRDQVIDLETWFEIHTNVSNVETASQKPYRLFNFFMISVILLQTKRDNKNVETNIREFQLPLRDFTAVTKLIKEFTSDPAQGTN